MLSTFFSKFGRPWLVSQRPIPGQKAQADDSSNPDKDKDEAGESGDKDVTEEQVSPNEPEGEVLNHEIEKQEISSLAVEIEVEEPGETVPTPGETILTEAENEVPVNMETDSIEQEVSLPETEVTTVAANSEDLGSENDNLMHATELSSDPPELPRGGSADVIQPVKNEPESVPALEDVTEGEASSATEVAEMEVKSLDAVVDNEVQDIVRDTVILSGVALEESKESVAVIPSPEAEIGNLEVLEAKMETLVAAMNNQKVEMVNLVVENPEQSAGNTDAVEATGAVKKLAAEIEGTLVGDSEVTVDVAPLTANDKGKSAEDTVLPSAEEFSASPIDEALVSSKPLPVLKEEASDMAPVEGHTDPIEEASSPKAISKDLDGMEDNELALVQQTEISDKVKTSSSKNEEKKSVDVGHNLGKDAQGAAPFEVELSPQAELVESIEIFKVRPGEELAEVNAVLKKYGITFKRKDGSEDQGDITVKITTQK